jgi:hypothetical protein
VCDGFCSDPSDSFDANPREVTPDPTHA